MAMNAASRRCGLAMIHIAASQADFACVAERKATKLAGGSTGVWCPCFRPRWPVNSPLIADAFPPRAEAPWRVRVALADNPSPQWLADWHACVWWRITCGEDGPLPAWIMERPRCARPDSVRIEWVTKLVRPMWRDDMIGLMMSVEIKNIDLAAVFMAEIEDTTRAAWNFAQWVGFNGLATSRVIRHIRVASQKDAASQKVALRYAIWPLIKTKAPYHEIIGTAGLWLASKGLFVPDDLLIPWLRHVALAAHRRK